MNTQKLAWFIASISLATPVFAETRTSASYSISTETINSGGARTTSADYTNNGSVGGIAGVSTVASPAETAKSGYVGQLFDVTGFTLTAVSLNVNEGTTDQLAAWQTLDDATFLAVPAASVAWSVQSGPLTGISAGGLATAGIVFQNTAATAQGIYLGQTGTLALTVLDTIPDNFGSYAGDGVGDDWQVQYFGQNNPLAAPNADADGTGQTNLFKYIAGLNPTDPNSRFTLTVAPAPRRADLHGESKNDSVGRKLSPAYESIGPDRQRPGAHDHRSQRDGFGEVLPSRDHETVAGYKSSSSRAGFSRQSLIRTRKVTASFPSTTRWS